mgnify:FL=1|jgi:hypothetical protein|tara:strand:+ start:734 stop:934 length:201 start_codon:yes stop_codon:yes gene_type:complete
MFDGIQYGVIPFFIQNYILKIGLESPTARLIKNIKLPEVIFTNEKISFSELYFLFLDIKWRNLLNM